MTTYQPSSDTATIAAQLTDAHRALQLGRPDAVWTTLQQIWNQQASPGLYTWDAPRPATEDVADGWRYVRGWHNNASLSGL